MRTHPGHQKSPSCFYSAMVREMIAEWRGGGEEMTQGGGAVVGKSRFFSIFTQPANDRAQLFVCGAILIHGGRTPGRGQKRASKRGGRNENAFYCIALACTLRCARSLLLIKILVRDKNPAGGESERE